MKRRTRLGIAIAAALGSASGGSAGADPVEAQVRQGDFEVRGALVQGALVRGRAPRGTTALLLDGRHVPLAEDGRFIIGLDRDQGPEARLRALLADGSSVERALTVSRRAWPVQHVRAALRPSGASEQFRRTREAELARIAAARAVETGSAGWQQEFIWPSRGRISGAFGSQRIYRGEPGAFHSGVDVAAGAGAPVLAPADGVVVLAGGPIFTLEGNLVIVDHGSGLNSAFLHLASVSVAEGQKLRRGDVIGTVGATGRATGPHLHWGLKWRDARIDPAAVAGPMR